MQARPSGAPSTFTGLTTLPDDASRQIREPAQTTTDPSFLVDQGADKVDCLFYFFEIEGITAGCQFELGRNGERYSGDREYGVVETHRVDLPNSAFALRRLDDVNGFPDPGHQEVVVEPRQPRTGVGRLESHDPVNAWKFRQEVDHVYNQAVKLHRCGLTPALIEHSPMTFVEPLDDAAHHRLPKRLLGRKVVDHALDRCSGISGDLPHRCPFVTVRSKSLESRVEQVLEHLGRRLSARGFGGPLRKRNVRKRTHGRGCNSNPQKSQNR